MTQKNNDNLEYVGKLYMGSDRFEVDVVFDTGSSWMIINDSRCDSSCKGLVYNATSSADYFEPKVINYRDQTYGSSYAEGFDVHDSVCIIDDPAACIKDFKWFAVVYEEGMDGLYGIVGMSTGLTRDSGPILVKALHEGGVISEPVFGWYLTGL
jgi:hypothetical protein